MVENEHCKTCIHKFLKTCLNNSKFKGGWRKGGDNLNNSKMTHTNMVNNYQSWRRLENDNKHEHGEHLMSKENPKKNNKHGHYDHLTLSIKKKRW